MRRKSKKPPSTSRLLAPDTEPYRAPDRMDVSVRKIANGYVVRKSGYEDGKHYEAEVFSPTKPTVKYETLKRESRLTGKEI